MVARILIAADSFKGSASSLEVGQALARGVRSVLPQAVIEVFAIADGGEGTVEAFAQNSTGQLRKVSVLSPDHQPLTAQYFLSQTGDFAVIEVAQASGITRVSQDRRQILKLSSYGTGQVILDALDQGVSQIYLGLGGSATNDMGLGIAQALGAVFLDEKGQRLTPLPEKMMTIRQIDLTGLDARLHQVEVILLADVTNPLTGPQGASAIFGPQKGASPQEVVYLDQALSHLADLIETDFSCNLKSLVGGGAAGGMGAGLHFFLKGRIRPGIETLLNLSDFPQCLPQADLVLTGEGRLDHQSLAGKVPIGVAKLASTHQVPTVAIVGSTSGDLTSAYQAGLAGVFPILSEPMSLKQAMTRTEELLFQTSRNLLHFYQELKKSKENT